MEIAAEIKAQFEFALKYVTDIVTNLVTDTALAKQVNDAVTAKLTDQKDKFVAAVQNEESDPDLTLEFK